MSPGTAGSTLPASAPDASALLMFVSHLQDSVDCAGEPRPFRTRSVQVGPALRGDAVVLARRTVGRRHQPGVDQLLLLQPAQHPVDGWVAERREPGGP